MIWPNPPEGNTPVKSFLRKLVNALRPLELQPGIGYKINRTPTGTSLSIQTFGGGGQGGGMNFRGVYSASAAYNVSDVVVTRTNIVKTNLVLYPTGQGGTNVAIQWATYVCMIANTGQVPTFPETGDAFGNPYWIMLAAGIGTALETEVCYLGDSYTVLTHRSLPY